VSRSRLLGLAAVAHAILGVLLLVPGLALALFLGWEILSGQPDPCGVFGCGLRYIFAFIGIVLAGVGGIHLRAALAIGRRRNLPRWIRVSGLIVSVLGLALSGFTAAEGVAHLDVITVLFSVVFAAVYSTATFGLARLPGSLSAIEATAPRGQAGGRFG
jgi:hypothetical protein